MTISPSWLWIGPVKAWNSPEVIFASISCAIAATSSGRLVYGAIPTMPGPMPSQVSSDFQVPSRTAPTRRT